MFVRALKVCVIMCMAALTGCSTIGGGPTPSFDLQADLKDLSDHYGTGTSIAEYYKAGSDRAAQQAARNKLIDGRIAQIDLRFIQYVRQLTANKQGIDSATQVGALALGLAGTLTGGIQAKSNLAAGVALLNGTDAIVDKNFFYEKSINALVATMYARRKEVLVGMLPKLTASADQYSLTATMADLDAYYHAGTLQGAVEAITTQASNSQMKSEATMLSYVISSPITGPAIDLSYEFSDLLAKISLEDAKRALTGLGFAAGDLPNALDDVGGKEGAKTILRKMYRDIMKLPDAEQKIAQEKLKTALVTASAPATP